MNKQNMQQHKQYPPELFDAIRNFMAPNSLEEWHYSAAFTGAFSKAVYLDRIIRTILEDKSDNDTLAKRLFKAQFGKKLLNDSFQKHFLAETFAARLIEAISQDKNIKETLKERLEKNTLKEKLLNFAYEKKLLTGVYEKKLLTAILKENPDKNIYKNLGDAPFKGKLVKTITEKGFSEKEILKVYDIIKKHDTEKDRLEIEKLINEKPLIVPPGLESAVLHFEAHFSVSGDGPIMILGPTGVGKSMFLYIARQLFKKKHQYDTNPPIIVEANCAHFSNGGGGQSLARSELFGHKKGSFTDARADKVGLVEKADGGLLILEEVGELPFEVQAMLLTFIETGEYRRLGDENVQTATVKIVAATNRESALRDDFRYRFFPYYIPPLRERKGDILYYFYEIFPEITKNFTKSEVLLLLTHHWPGNVREIERIGRLLNRNKWIDEQIHKEYPGNSWVPSPDRIVHLDPRDTSFDPEILKIFRGDLINWEVDVSFLEKLFKKHRVSVINENNQKAFKELSERSNSYFSAFCEYSLKFPIKFKPFDDAYKGYLIFCDLFLQDPAKDDNILATIKNQCTTSAYNYMDSYFNNKPSYQRPLNALRRQIMKYLSEFDGPEYDHIDNPLELWSVLEQKQIDRYKDPFGAEFESEEVLSAISELKEVELLKRYYRKQLEKTGGNIKEAAKRIGLKENTFRSRIKNLEMEIRK